MPTDTKTARFLLTTAREEVGKAFIMLDMCRLDFARHQSVLRRLCTAFYSHIEKQAYFDTLQFEGLQSFAHVAEWWRVEMIKWFPGDLEGGGVQRPWPAAAGSGAGRASGVRSVLGWCARGRS